MTYPSRVPTVTVYSGDTTDWPDYQFNDDDGDPVNLSTYTWAAQWRATPDATDSITLTVDVSSAATGLLGVSATAVQTAQFATQGVWDLQSTLAGVIRTWVYGAVQCTKDVTRAS